MKSSGTPKMMTIGQLAERFGLATHVLRHWESIGLLTPAARMNGRRLYHHEHIARVTLILRGKSAGLRLDQLRAVLAAPNGAMRRSLLAEHHAELERRIRETVEAKELIEHALECEADDFTQCHAFRHLAEASLQAVPIGMTGGRQG
ncbi:MerR family transcriptional regulator [Micromonospora sp. RB23]